MRVRVRFLAPALLASAALLPITSGPVALTASSPAGCEHLPGDGDSAARVDDFVRELPERARADQAGIDRRLLARFCLERINAGGLERVSYASDVTVRSPAIYYDRDSGQYMSLSYWDWRNRNFEYPSAWSGGTVYNMGQQDGFGIAYDKNVYMRSYRISYWGFSTDPYIGFPTTYSSTAATANAAGVGFRFQDKMKRTAPNGTYQSDGNIAHGQLVNFFLNGQSGCRSIYGFAKVSHTWSSTGVSSVSISPGSVGFSFSSTSSRWENTGQPGTAATIC